jgi:2,5-diketo-D-gluconate reductase A
MTELAAEGRLVTAGVSNFQPAHLDRLVTETGVAPAVNQIEVHPGFNNSAARDASRRHGTQVEAWSPLGQGKILDEDTITQIASRQGRSNAQVILRWHTQHGHVVIVKSMHRDRMKANLDLGFELSQEEIATIDALDRGEAGRVGPNPDAFDWLP